MLTMMLAAVFATALAPDPANVTSDPPTATSVAAAPAPPPGAAPGARIFSYADLKAMDAKGGDRRPLSKRVEPTPNVTRVAVVHPHRRALPSGRHAPAPTAQTPTSPKLRPAFAMKDGVQITR